MLGGARRGHTSATHQILGKTLRGLDARRLACRPKNGKAARLKEVHDTSFERYLRAYQREVDELVLSQMRELLVLVDADGDAPRE